MEMIVKYILFVVMMNTSAAPPVPAAMTSAEFDSFDACRSAGDELRFEYGKMLSFKCLPNSKN